MTYLIICDPSGLHSLRLIEKGISPDDITVYENTHKGQNMSRRRGVHVITDISEPKYDPHRIVIGNPPYSDRSNASGSGTGGTGRDLDSEFFLRSMACSDDVRLIIRAKHFTDKGSKFRKKLFASGLVSIRYLSPKTFPNVQNTMTCVVSWQRGYSGPTVITFSDGTVLERVLTSVDLVKLDNPNYVGEVSNNLSHRFVSGKLIRRSIVDHKDGQPMVEICGGGETPVIRHIAPGIEDTGRNQHGVIMNYSASWGGLGRLFVKPYDASISNSVVLLCTDTEKQAQQLLAYLQSDEVKQCVKDNMLSFHPTKSLFATIPDVAAD